MAPGTRKSKWTLRSTVRDGAIEIGSLSRPPSISKRTYGKLEGVWGPAQGQNLTGRQPRPGLGPKFDGPQFDGRPERCPKFDVLTPPVWVTALGPWPLCCLLISHLTLSHNMIFLMRTVYDEIDRRAIYSCATVSPVSLSSKQHERLLRHARI